MNIKEITEKYRDLINMGGFARTPIQTQVAVDFMTANASNIDFVFDDVDDIFKLIALMTSRDDPQSFQTLLKNGFDINTVNSSFETCFTKDSNFHRKIIFTTLAYDAGARFTKKNSQDKNFFQIALEGNSSKEVKDFLMSLPEFLNSTQEVGEGGMTLFHTAVEKGDVETVKQILSQGFDVDAHYTHKELKGNSMTKRAIHIACEKRNIEMLKLLIKNGADVNYKTSNGKTPLELVLEKDRVTDRNDDKTKRFELIDFLIKSGTNRESLNEAFKKIMLDAAQSMNKDFFAFDAAIKLSEYGADMNFSLDDGSQIIHLAAISGHFEIFKLCVKAGANINGRNNNGDTPLILASHAGRIHNLSDKIIMALAKIGADIHATNNKNESAIDILSKQGKAQLLEFLLTTSEEKTSIRLSCQN
ncbi:MAG: ankyrin repeat domain-containing protein [Firmicutes bacterium]|nr:ankyrin repeat domain-containing protein [Bacillota bacterium]